MRLGVGARRAIVALHALAVPPRRVLLERAGVRIVARRARQLVARAEPARAAHEALGVIEQLHAILLRRICEEVDAHRVERLARTEVEVIAALAQHRERRLMTLRADLELAARRQLVLRADGVLGAQRRDVLLARPVAALAADAVRQRIAKPLRRLVAVARDAIRIERDADPRVAAERHRIEIPARGLRVVVDRQMDQPAAALGVEREPVAAGAEHVRDRFVPRCDRARPIFASSVSVTKYALAAPHRRVAEVAALVHDRRRGVEDLADPRLIDRRDRPHARCAPSSGAGSSRRSSRDTAGTPPSRRSPTDRARAARSAWSSRAARRPSAARRADRRAPAAVDRDAARACLRTRSDRSRARRRAHAPCLSVTDPVRASV